MSEDALVAREQRGNISVLTMVYRPYNLLGPKLINAIVEQIEQASGRKVKASRKVDPDLIGGIVLQAGSMRLDASVRGRLDRLRHDFAHARS